MGPLAAIGVDLGTAGSNVTFARAFASCGKASVVCALCAPETAPAVVRALSQAAASRGVQGRSEVVEVLRETVGAKLEVANPTYLPPGTRQSPTS